MNKRLFKLLKVCLCAGPGASACKSFAETASTEALQAPKAVVAAITV